MTNEIVSVETEHSSNLANAEIAPSTFMDKAGQVANVCKQIVLSSSANIQGKKYVKVEGWQAIATAHGCIASSGDVEKLEGGVKAMGYIKRMSDGAIIAQAEGFCGDDEKTWSNRNEYAKRAMAQTRAISRACRSAFAHVVVMMNAGLETTPAEEIPFEDKKPTPHNLGQDLISTIGLDNEIAAIDYLVSLGWLKQDEPLSKLSEPRAKQILSRPEDFLKKLKR